MPDRSKGRNQTKGSPVMVSREKHCWEAGVGVRPNYLTLSNMKVTNREMNLGYYGTPPTEADPVVPGSGGGKAPGVVISRNPCTAESSQDTRISEEKKKKKRRRKVPIKIGTWNVRTMMRAGKLENIKREMDRGNIDALGLCEVRWKDSGDYWSDSYRVIYSGGVESQRGVAIVLNAKLGMRVVNIEQVSDRIVVVEIKARPTNFVLVQVYMPTSNHREEEVDGVYEQIEEIIREVPGKKNLIVMGDWNAVVGEGRDGYEVGGHGLGTRNDRGEKAVEFCRRNKLVVTNTWFKHHPRRRYTWKMPGDSGRYQIDYIMVRQRYKNSVKNSRSYPGADADSDHNLVMMHCEVRFKKLNKSKRIKRWNLEALKGEKRREYQELVDRNSDETKEMGTIEEKWENIKTGIVRAAEKAIGSVETRKLKKQWVTEEMTRKMDERREWKNVNTDIGKMKYRKLNNQLRRITTRAKENWWKKQCEEMEKLQKEGEMGALYAKVKLLSGGKRGQMVPKIKDKTGRTLIEQEDIQDRWREYVEELYDSDNRPSNLDIEE